MLTGYRSRDGELRMTSFGANTTWFISSWRKIEAVNYSDMAPAIPLHPWTKGAPTMYGYINLIDTGYITRLRDIFGVARLIWHRPSKYPHIYSNHAARLAWSVHLNLTFFNCRYLSYFNIAILSSVLSTRTLYTGMCIGEPEKARLFLRSVYPMYIMYVLIHWVWQQQLVACCSQHPNHEQQNQDTANSFPKNKKYAIEVATWMQATGLLHTSNCYTRGRLFYLPHPLAKNIPDHFLTLV